MIGLMRLLRRAPASRTVPRPPAGTRAPRQANLHNDQRRREQSAVIDLLDNPSLQVEAPDAGFDPYDSGAFDRGDAWKRSHLR